MKIVIKSGINVFTTSAFIFVHLKTYQDEEGLQQSISDFKGYPYYYNFVQRQFVVYIHTLGGDVVHTQQLTSPLLAEFHYGAHIILRNHYIRLHDRFFNVVDLRLIRKVGRILDHFYAAVVQNDFINHD